MANLCRNPTYTIVAVAAFLGLRRAEIRGRDFLLPEWHGWHAFRRGLATSFHRLVSTRRPSTLYLRHSNVATTMNIYVKTVSEDSTAAMKLLKTALCANCAPAPTPNGQRMVN